MKSYGGSATPTDLVSFDTVIVYTGSIEDAPELIQFFRRETENLRALRRVIISPEPPAYSVSTRTESIFRT